MFFNFFEFLHVAPLAGIVAVLIFSLVARIRSKEIALNVRGLLIGFCALGIMAGTQAHHSHILEILDPCMAYAAVLAGVAVSLFKAVPIAQKVSR